METRIVSLFAISVLFVLIIGTTFWSSKELMGVDHSFWPKGYTGSGTSSTLKHARDRTAKSTSANVFYNRVPKCGSRSLTNVLRRLTTTNNFTIVASNSYNSNLTKSEIREEVTKMGHYPERALFQKHMLYVDFRRRGYEQPIYINLIRDPIERFASMYSYRKYGTIRSQFELMSSWPNISECIMTDHPECALHERLSVIVRYFCGVAEKCKADNVTADMVRLARKHLDEEYLAVGLTEEFDSSLQLFETLLPSYFAGALKSWEKNSNSLRDTATRKKEEITEEARKKLKRKLAGDYKVYNFAKAKFAYLKKKYGIR